jgi:hypothetical protein
MLMKKFWTLVLGFVLLFISSEIIFAQQTTTAKKTVWKPIGCLYPDFEAEGLVEEQLGWSFSDEIRLGGRTVFFKKITSDDVKKLVQNMASSVTLDVDVRYTDLIGNKLKSFNESKIAKDGSIVIEVAYLKEVLQTRNGWNFFKAIIAHELGHLIEEKRKTIFQVNMPSSVEWYEYEQTPTAKKGVYDLKRKIIKKTSINYTLQKEMKCDVWAGYIFSSTSIMSDSDFRDVVIKWKDSGDTRELEERTHGSPFTRGILFKIGWNIPDLAKKGYKYISLGNFDDGGELFIAVDDKVLSYCHPEDSKCTW